MSLPLNAGVGVDNAGWKSCGSALPAGPEKRAESKVVARPGVNSSPPRCKAPRSGTEVITKKKPMDESELRDGGCNDEIYRENGARNSSSPRDDWSAKNCNGSEHRPQEKTGHRKLVMGVLSCVGWCYKQKQPKLERRKYPLSIKNGELTKSLPPEKIDVKSWEFDVFCVDKKLKGHSLEVVFLELLEILDLYKSMNLDSKVCCNYIRAIANRYKDNPYHNSVHAADVLQAVGVILLEDSYYKHFTPLELLTLVLSAAVHDVGHPGVNNKYHEFAKTDLAHCYESSMNEQMHIQLSYDILEERNDTQNMLKPLSEEDRNLVRNYIKNIILATDMAVHFSLVEEFGLRFPKNNSCMTRELSQEEKDLLLRMIVHCADISNPTRRLELCTQWSTQIAKEMWEQGDRERKKGFTVSPGCDRYHGDLALAQKNFLEQFVIPCFEKFSSVVPNFTKMALGNAEKNRQHWERESHSN